MTDVAILSRAVAAECPSSCAITRVADDMRAGATSSTEPAISDPWDEAAKYLIRDRDRVYGTVVTGRLQVMGIRDRPITPGSQWQNGYAERLIGSIRRERLDHVIVLGEGHLRRVLRNYANYYNTVRTHWSLDTSNALNRTSLAILGGLHHQYVRH